MERRYSEIVRGINIRTRKGFNQLYRQYQETNDATLKEEMVLSNMPLVKKTAKKIHDALELKNLDIEDLVQVGWEGLSKSFDRYDPEKGLYFSTIAGYYIKGYILNETRSFENTIRVPYSYVGEKRKKKLERTRTISLQTSTINELILESSVSDSRSTNPFDESEDRVTAQGVLAIEELTERERNIIKARYGIDKPHPQTLLEVAEIYGVTIERIRQIQKKAEAKIRRHFLNGTAQI